MSILPLSIASICYLCAGINNIRTKDYNMAIVYLSYFTANTALVWYEIKK